MKCTFCSIVQCITMFSQDISRKIFHLAYFVMLPTTYEVSLCLMCFKDQTVFSIVCYVQCITIIVHCLVCYVCTVL